MDKLSWYLPSRSVPEEVREILSDGIKFVGFTVDQVQLLYYMYTDRRRAEEIKHMSERGELDKLLEPVLGFIPGEKDVHYNTGNLFDIDFSLLIYQ